MVLTTYWEVENEHNRHSVEVEVKLGLVIILSSWLLRHYHLHGYQAT